MRHYCKCCKFFDPHIDDEPVHTGWCIRYPPTYVGHPYDMGGHPSDNEDVMDTLCWANPVVGIMATCGERKKDKRCKST